MIDPNEINQKVETLDVLLRAKLGVRGTGLEARLSKAGRLLPKRVRKAGQVVVNAHKNSMHPRLALTVDTALVNVAYREITAYLTELNPTERRKTVLLQWLAGQVFNLLLIAAVVAVVLRWQGVI